MNTQMLLGAIWIASLVSVGIWQNHQGHTTCEFTHVQRESADLQAANDKIIDLANARIVEARNNASRLAAVSSQFEKEKQDESKKRDLVIADLRAERIRLRDPGKPRTAGDAENRTTPATGQCDGGTQANLSIEASEFLVRLAGEADEIVHQLTGCQSVVLTDRGMTAKPTEGEGNGK